MKDEHSKLRMAMRTRQGTLVPLSVAASLTYFHLHRSFRLTDETGLERALNDAAMALVHIADVYYTAEGNRVVRIPDDELQGGLFEGGAKTFKAAHGHIYRGLAMRRIEVMDALAILEKAREVLNTAATKPADIPSEK
jgi:hypothetical protein